MELGLNLFLFWDINRPGIMMSSLINNSFALMLILNNEGSGSLLAAVQDTIYCSLLLFSVDYSMTRMVDESPF